MRILISVLLSSLLIACSDTEQATITDARVIETGRVIYLRECSVCHGREGAGDGIATPALSASLRPVYEWVDEYDVEELRARLQTGHQPAFTGNNIDSVFSYIKATHNR